MRRVRASMLVMVMTVFALGVMSQSVLAAATAPTNVTAVASATSGGAIDVTWQDQNPDPFFYQIQILDSGGAIFASKTVAGSLSQTTVTGLTDGAGYRVVVKAVEADGSIASAAPVGPVTPYGTPDEPTISAVTPADSAATITWAAPNNNGSAITGYKVNVYRGDTLNRSTDVGIVTSYNVTGLTNGTPYSFRVVASNLRGDSDESLALEGTPVGTPGAVSSLVANATDSSVSLTWAAPTNNGGSPIVTYRIAVSPSLGGADETSTTASKTITGLTNGTQYTFTVFATNEAGLESLAASVVATPVGAGNPAIGLITPNYAKAGAGGGGNTIVLDGTDLDGIDDLAGPNGVLVQCPGTGTDVEASIQGATATRVTFTAPVCSTAGDATVKVKIGSSVVDGETRLKYVATPTLSASPDPTTIGATSGSVRQVALTGTNFVAGQMRVILDGVVVSPTVTTSTTIIFTAPALTGTPTLPAAKSIEVQVANITELRSSSGRTLTYDKVANTGAIASLASFNYGQQGPLVSVTALNGAGGAVITSTSASVCSISSGRVVAVKAGTCTVQAVINSSAFYTIATFSQSVNIGRGTQTLGSTTSTSLGIGQTADLAQTVTVTGSGAASTGARSYALSQGASACSVSTAGLLTALAVGTCSVVVSTAQTDHYNSNSIVVSITITATSAGSTAFERLTPVRIADTRSAVGVSKGRVGDGVGGGAPLRLNVLGKGGLPGSVGSIGAVSLNVTAVDGVAPDAGGYVSVYPCGSLPDVSSLNFVSGSTVANAVISPVSSAGEVCVYVYGQADILIDVNGYFAAP